VSHDYSKPYMDKYAMDEYFSTDAKVSKRYGRIVRAIPISNREFQYRYDKLSSSRDMRPPPSSGRIFAGYLVIRNLGLKNECETWIPDSAFEEVYEQKAETINGA